MFSVPKNATASYRRDVVASAVAAIAFVVALSLGLDREFSPVFWGASVLWIGAAGFAKNRLAPVTASGLFAASRFAFAFVATGEFVFLLGGVALAIATLAVFVHFDAARKR